MRDALKAWIGRKLLSGFLGGIVMDSLRRRGLRLWGEFGGHTFSFTPGDLIGDYLLAEGNYQEDLTARTMELLGGPKRILEIGANIGTQTIYFFDHGAEHVTAIEPAPINLTLLRANVRLNGREDQVHIIPVAASSSAGTASFAQYRYNQGRSAIVNASVGDGIHEIITVPTRRAGDLIDFVPDLIWVDVEEHEIEVMRGLGKLLGRPMLVEFGRHSISDEDLAYFRDQVLPLYSCVRAYELDFKPVSLDDLEAKQYNLLLT